MERQIFSYIQNLNVAYDPELDMYAIMDEDGYVVDRYNTREEAEDVVKSYEA